MSEAAKRWNTVLRIAEVKEQKLFASLSRGRFKEESKLNVTLVAPTEADAEEARKGARVHDDVLDLCTTTVYGEKRGVKVVVSAEEFAAAAAEEAAPPPGPAAAGAPAASAPPSGPGPAASPEGARPGEGVAPDGAASADATAKIEAEVRAQVEAEFKVKLDEEVRRRMEEKLSEEREREAARKLAGDLERARRSGLIEKGAEVAQALWGRFVEMKDLAHPDLAWKLRPRLEEAVLMARELEEMLPRIERRDEPREDR